MLIPRRPFLRQEPREPRRFHVEGFPPRFVVALPVLVARVPLPDPRGRPRLSLVLLSPSTAPVDVDAVALDVAGVTLGCVGGVRECPGTVVSLAFGSSGVSHGNRYSTSWLRLLPPPRVTF